MDSISMHISIGYHYAVVPFDIVCCVVLPYIRNSTAPSAGHQQNFFLLPHKTRLLFHSFSIFLSLFVFKLIIFKVRPVIWITRYIYIYMYIRYTFEISRSLHLPYEIISRSGIWNFFFLNKSFSDNK